MEDGESKTRPAVPRSWGLRLMVERTKGRGPAVVDAAKCPVPRRSSRSTSFPLQMASHKIISNRKKGTTEEKRQGKKARMAERRQNNRTAPRRRRRRRNATRLCKAVKTNHPGAVCTPGWPLRPPVAALGQGWLQLKGGELGLVPSTASPGDRTASKSNAGAAGHSVPLVPWPKWPGW